MTARKSAIRLLFALLLLGRGLLPAELWGQQGGSRLHLGVELYGRGQWGDAIVELRRAQGEALDPELRAEAQFWIAMSELSAGRFRDAIHSFDEVNRIDPRSPRRLDTPYQKGRSLYYLGSYNEAIVLFKNYAESIQVDGRYIQGVRVEAWLAESDNGDMYNKKAAAVYWIGECLYALEQWDKAEEVFEMVTRQYPASLKYEASVNRLALIKQKKTTEGLLEIIRLTPTGTPLSPQGSSSSSYDDAVLAYKNSIAPFIAQPPASAQQTVPSPPSPQFIPQQTVQPVPSKPQNTETIMRLLNIKTQALEMLDRLTTTLNSLETMEWERW